MARRILRESWLLPDLIRPSLQLLSGVLCMLAPAALWAEGLDDWRLRGSNTMRYEYYQNRGSPNVSPWPDEGDQWFDELQLDVLRQQRCEPCA